MDETEKESTYFNKWLKYTNKDFNKDKNKPFGKVKNRTIGKASTSDVIKNLKKAKPHPKAQAKKEKANYKSPYLELDKKFHIEDKDLFKNWLLSKPVTNKDAGNIKAKKRERKDVNLVSIEGSIDLHNFTVYEALGLLKHFIIESRGKHCSVVKIIHGKGKHSINNEPLIKNAVLEWLQKEGKAFVIVFKEASRKHGGEGSTIVWLKS